MDIASSTYDPLTRAQVALPLLVEADRTGDDPSYLTAYAEGLLPEEVPELNIQRSVAYVMYSGGFPPGGFDHDLFAQMQADGMRYSHVGVFHHNFLLKWADPAEAQTS